MNIFILDKDQEKSAVYQVDKHIVKMALEQDQILCTTHHLSGTDPSIIPYRATHKNHPSSVWCRKSLSNYIWLCDFTTKICKEYTYRYGKIHKCEQVAEWCRENLPNIPDVGLTPFALAMPDDCKDPDPVKAYRRYYIKHKQHLFSWKKREVPYWIKEWKQKSY